jgi:hypothetical protein
MQAVPSGLSGGLKLPAAEATDRSVNRHGSGEFDPIKYRVSTRAVSIA